jgi:hypothetical protein
MSSAIQKGHRMRKGFFALFTAMFMLAGGVAAASAIAKPVDPAPLHFPVSGTFSTGPGEAATPFSGVITVDRFVEQDGELALQGTVASTDEVLFDPNAITVSALAQASDDETVGCTVDVSTANAFIDPSFIIFVEGARFSLTESGEPDAARELCRVVQTETKDPADQSALARALNKVLAAH